jgi:hypothetical protein
MTEAIQPREDVVVEQSAATRAPADDGIQALLDEFDRANPQQPDPNGQDVTDDGSAGTNNIDQLLAEFAPSADQQRLTELTERNATYEQERALNQLRESVVKFADELQEVCPNINVQDRLELMAARDPKLLPAFQCSGLSDTERAIARADHQAAVKLHQRWLAEPDSNPNKQSALRDLEAQAERLWFMVNGKQIVRDAVKALRKENADKVPDMTREDWLVTADHNMVAQAVRDARGELNPKPEVIEWGKLSGAEGRQKVKDEFGFDPGWGH